jgi:hypothetical protein
MCLAGYIGSMLAHTAISGFPVHGADECLVAMRDMGYRSLMKQQRQVLSPAINVILIRSRWTKRGANASVTHTPHNGLYR